jgi:hypothetical protein
MRFSFLTYASIAFVSLACGGASSDDETDIGALEHNEPPPAANTETDAVITTADGLEIRASLVDVRDERTGKIKDTVLRVTRGAESLSFNCADPRSRVSKNEPSFFDLACYHTLPSREHAAIHLNLEEGKLRAQVDVSHGASDPKVAAAYKLVAGAKAKADLGYVVLDATLGSNPQEPNRNPFALLAHVTAPVEDIMKNWPGSQGADSQPNTIEVTVFAAMYLLAAPVAYEPIPIAANEGDAWSGVATKETIKEQLLTGIR